MDEGFWINQSLRRLVEAAALFRHRARVIADEFSEATHLWPDQRAKAFTSAHLQPQLSSISEAEIQLQRQVEAAHAALQAATSAENHIHLCQAALTEHEREIEDTRRLCRAVFDLAGRVTVEARDLTAVTDDIDVTISKLLA